MTPSTSSASRRTRSRLVAASLHGLVGAAGIFSTVTLLTTENIDYANTFTAQSNAAMGAIMLWRAVAIYLGRCGPALWLVGCMVLYLSITGLVYNIVIAPTVDRVADPPTWLVGHLLSNSQLEHIVNPIAVMALWIIFAKHRALGWSWAWKWLAYLVFYVGYNVLAGVLMPGFEFPYPFMDVRELGWAGIGVNFAVYMTAFWVLGAVLVGADKRLPERTALTVDA